MHIVLDTNVVMALWVFADPNLIALQRQIQAQNIHLLACAECLEELKQVLSYSQFKLSPEQQQNYFAQYFAQIKQANAPADSARNIEELPLCRDRDDQKFLHVAWLGHAEYLLTRDKALLRLARHTVLRNHLKIMTPEQFVTQLAANDIQPSPLL